MAKGTHLLLLLTNPPSLVFLHDVLEPVLRLTTCRCPLSLPSVPGGATMGPLLTPAARNPREPVCLAQGIQHC